MNVSHTIHIPSIANAAMIFVLFIFYFHFARLWWCDAFVFCLRIADIIIISKIRFCSFLCVFLPTQRTKLLNEWIQCENIKNKKKEENRIEIVLYIFFLYHLKTEEQWMKMKRKAKRKEKKNTKNHYRVIKWD